MPSSPLSSPFLTGARKLFHQWLDGADDRRSVPLFVAGTPGDGVGAVLGAICDTPQGWFLGADSLAHQDGRLRDPGLVASVVWAIPADVVALDAGADLHLLDRLLDAHADARAVWLVRPWRDAAAAWLDLEGAAPRRALAAIADGRASEAGPLGERLPDALVDQICAVSPADLSDAAGAAMAWYVRHSVASAIGLADHPRVTRLVVGPGTITSALRAAGVHREVAWTPPDGGDGLPEVGGDVAALCEALAGRLGV